MAEETTAANAGATRGATCPCGGAVPPPLPPDEAERLQALRGLNILDTPPEERFDRIVRLAAAFFRVPIAYVSFVDRNRQWFKSRLGLGLAETPRDISFCGYAILEENGLVVPDTLLDARFARNPMVVGEPHVRFYAGYPLKSKGGRRVGTLCLMDSAPREFASPDREILRGLAGLVEREMELIGVIRAQDEILQVKQQLLDSQNDLARLYRELELEQAKSERLLLNILPSKIASELKNKGSVDAVLHDDVTVMFTDFTGFTQASRRFTACDLIGELNACFSAFDAIVTRHRIEKLKTIGDGYLAAAGLVEPSPSPALDMVRAAIEIRDWLAQRKAEMEALGRAYWHVRIGIHAGPLIAGVIGETKFAYDIWGDTVNTASRLESTSEPGRINASQAVVDRLGGAALAVPRGMIPVKGVGEMPMFFIESPAET